MQHIIDILRSHISNIIRVLYLPSIGISDIIEMIIIAFVLYKIILAIRNTRAWAILKGVFVLFLGYVIAYAAGFDIIKTIFQSSVIFVGMTLIMVFQNDIKLLLEQLGTRKLSQYFSDFKNKKKDRYKRFSDDTINEITGAVFSMSKVKTGALIVIEKNTPLTDIIRTGIDIDAKITGALLINTFEKNTPLHDGAVVLSGDRLISATCVLPLTSKTNISKSYGTRHRAGIGLSEYTDCFVLIVSEETGGISYVENGIIKKVKDKDSLKEILKKVQNTHNTEEGNIKSIGKSLAKNIGVAIASGIMGVSLWVIGMAILDPISTKTISNIPITIINEGAIEDNNKMYDIGNTSTISVLVEDKRSVLRNLTPSNVTATIDLSKLTFANTVDVDTYINNTTTEIKSISNKVINVNIYDISYAEFPIEINTVGTPNDGYSIRDIELNNKTVTITGAERQIKKIDKVVAKIDINNIKDGESISSGLTVYDRNGDIVSPEKLTFSVDKTTATVYLEKTKSIKLNILAKDTEDSAGTISYITYEPEEVAVIGDINIINEMESIDIDLPVKIEVSDDSNTKLTKIISLKDYLTEEQMEGIKLTDEDLKITIDITYQPYNSRVITVNADKVKFFNNKPDLDYDLTNKKVEVKVLAKDSILNQITVDDLSLSCDVDEFNSEGTYDVTISVASNKNILTSNVPAKVIISKEIEEKTSVPAKT